MKNKTLKALAASVATLGVASAAFAQGTIPVANQGQINFNTFNATTSKGQVFLPASTTQVGATFNAQLFYSLTQNGAMTPLSAVVQFGANGYVAQGVINDVNDEASTVIWYELVVWNSAAGATYQAATGLTNPGNGVTPGVGTITPAAGLTAYGTSAETKGTLGGQDQEGDVPSAPPTANGFNNLTLTPVPEPTTIALGGLGAAALLALRRRK